MQLWHRGDLDALVLEGSRDFVEFLQGVVMVLSFIVELPTPLLNLCLMTGLIGLAFRGK